MRAGDSKRNEADPVVCRCEEITLSEIEEAVDAGCRSVGAVKRYTRAGMGPCQGRSCGTVISGIIARKTDRDPLEVGADNPRFPTVPLTIEKLKEIGEESGGSNPHRESPYPEEPPAAGSPPEAWSRTEYSQAGPRPMAHGSAAGGPSRRSSIRVVVIGGGYHGTAAAYYLAKAGVDTVLLEKNEIGTGASGCNFGCVQLQDSNLGLSLELNSRGFTRMPSMEQELDADLEFRYIDSLLYAQNGEELAELEKLQAEKQRTGLEVLLLGPEEVPRYEPHIDTSTLTGATQFRQSNVNPFKYLFALAGNGRRHGLEIREHSEVREILVEGAACTGVRTSDGDVVEADYVVLAAGAWTPRLAAGCGIRIPVEYVIGEAFVTEPLRPFLHTFLSSASFFTTAHGGEGAATSFTAVQTASGNILMGETAEPGPENPDLALQLTSDDHCRNIPAQLEVLFPGLASVSVMRSWTTCSPSTPDFEPFLGPAAPAGPENLLLAAGFKSSVVISTVVGEVIRDLVLRGKTFCDLSPFTSRIERMQT